MARTLGLFLACLCLSIGGCKAIEGAIYRDAIKKVIHEDALTGTDPTFGHAATMRKIDLSDCPSDFREVYIRHIQAWDTVAKVEAARLELEKGVGAAVVGGAIATLFDSTATPLADHGRAMTRNQQEGASAKTDVGATWNDVEAVAAKYGIQFQR